MEGLTLGENKMSKKAEQIKKDIESSEAELKAKSHDLNKIKQEYYYLKKEAENLEQNAKRQQNLNTFKTFLYENPSKKHESIKELYTNEDARIHEYIRTKFTDLEKCDNFEDFKVFLKEFFTDAIVFDQEIDQTEIVKQIQRCEDRNKKISDKFTVHFDILNEIIESLKKIFDLQEANLILSQVAEKLEISKEKLSDRILLNRNCTDTIACKPSVADIELIEDMSSNLPNEHDVYSEGGDEKLQDLLEAMMKDKFDFTNVKCMPSLANKDLRTENLKEYAIKRNSGEGNCAVWAICDSLNISHDKAQQIRQEISDIVLACASLERSEGPDNVKIAFKRIFNENFLIFKTVALHFYDQCVMNVDTNDETRQNLTVRKELLFGASSWENLTQADWKSTSNTVRFNDVQFGAILADHRVDEGDYQKYVCTDGIWLNNHEVSAFLLRRGYVFNGIDHFAGTILKYKNVCTQDHIYLHNDSVDDGIGTEASGVHWQAAELRAKEIGVAINEDCSTETTESMIEGRIEYKKRLLIKYKEILALYKGKYQNYTKRQIRKYGTSTRKSPLKYEELSAIAAVMRANEIASGHSLRDVQILAILEFFEEDINMFCQINTGEGKTAITSAIAVIRSLQGHTVDIMTSNSVLAEDAVKDRQNFYALFGLSVTHNNPNPKEPYVKGLRPCYGHDIVYGTIGTFAFDYLHNNVEALDTKVLQTQNGIPTARECNTVIVDEVDNVILDNYALFTNQSNSVAGIDHVKFIYIDIWQKLCKAEQELGADPSNFTDQMKEAIRKKIDVKEIEQKITADTKIPRGFRAFICSKLQLLLDNAIKSKYDLHEDEDYVIGVRDSEDNILPLEKEIGVRLQNFIWTDLHPFLQMKHNLHVNSCGSLTSVFIPNCSYLRLYTRIYGLTGTLGSLKERQFIYEIYAAESTIIPPFTPSQRTDCGKRIVDNEPQWLEALKNVAFECRTRALLFVCDTPKALKKIQQNLRTNGFSNIITYENENDAHKISALKSSGGAKVGTIFIATNIGGRGTDIILSESVVLNGGLHECTTNLPKNIRTEKQAAGRAARGGQNGTTEIVFQRSEFEELKNAEPNLLQVLGEDEIAYAVRLRDAIEEARLEKAAAHVQAIICNYRIFKRFENYYYFSKKHRNINHYILEDLKFKFGLCYYKADTGQLQTFFQRINLDTNNSFACYEFVNQNYRVKYAQSLLRAGEFEQAHQILSATKAAKSFAHEELCSLPAYYLTMFEILLTEDHSIFLRLFDPIFGLCPAISGDSENGEHKREATMNLTEARVRLEHRADAISELIDSADFQSICLSKAEQAHNFGENMMLTHLESEQAVIINTLIHVERLRIFIEQNSESHKRVYVKRSYQFQEIKENGLDVDLTLKGISTSELILADKEGLGIFFELDVLAQIRLDDPAVIEANAKIISAVAMLSTAYIPNVGLIMAPMLSIPAGKLLRCGIKQILGVVFNDPEIYNEVEDLGEYVLDVLSSFGGPVTTLPKILKTVLMEIGQSLVLKLLIRKFGEEISGYIEPIINPIMQLIQPILAKICEIKEYIYNNLKNLILDPIKDVFQQLIVKANELFRNIETGAAQATQLTIIPLVEEASLDFQTIINDIIDIKSAILKFWENGFEIFNQFKSVASKFPKFSGNIIRQIIDFVKLIRDFINGALSTSIKTIIEKVGNLVDGIIELIRRCKRTIKDKVRDIISKIKMILNKILSNPQQFLSEIRTFIKGNIMEHIHEILSAISIAFVQKVDGIFDTILRNNPIDKCLAKHGIDLSKTATVVEKLSSLAVNQILKFIQTLILQPELQVPQLENSETMVPASGNCIPEALKRLLQLDNLDELLCVTRAYIGKKVKQNNGLTRWETRFILEDLGLKVVEPSTNGHHSETASHSLEQYRSIGGVGLFVRRDSTGHAYCINKDGQSVRFVDNYTGNSEASAQELAEYTKWYLLIPMNFSERQKDIIKKRIRENPHPNDAFSFVYIIRQLWEELFSSQTFGAIPFVSNELQGEYYPHGMIRIKADKRLLKGCLKDFHKELSKNQTGVDNFSRSGRYSTTIPVFGAVPGKTQMMMGVLTVTLTDNSKFERIAVSGNTRFFKRWDPITNEPLDMYVPNYHFVHSNPDGSPSVYKGPDSEPAFILDLFSREQTKHQYNSCCAAQKLLYALCEHMKAHPTLRIKGDMRMAEAWYIHKKPPTVMQDSCDKCKIVLPIVTGAENL